MFKLKSKESMIAHTDNNIRAEIWAEVWGHDNIRFLDISNFSVTVEDSVVSLKGHLIKDSNFRLIEKIAYSIPGVIAVNNMLVVDNDLTIQVAQALARDERTRSFIIHVGCTHGWVRLGGDVPTFELQLVAEEIAGQLPSVRGVVSLPNVAGKAPFKKRQRVQPQIHAKIYDHSSEEGKVTQIVIQPRNRLVTHVVGRTKEYIVDEFVFHEFLVPIEAVEVVNQNGLILKRNGSPLIAFPTYESSNYELAPLDWQPPYPYTAGTILWPLDEKKIA